MMWRVYGIVSPITLSIIYVGCTSQPLERRLSQHTGDTCSAAYESIQFIRSRGLEPLIVCIEDFSDVSEALLFETRMITSIKGLANKQHHAARNRLAVAALLEDHEIAAIMAGGDVVLKGWRAEADAKEAALLSMIGSKP